MAVTKKNWSCTFRNLKVLDVFRASKILEDKWGVSARGAFAVAAAVWPLPCCLSRRGTDRVPVTMTSFVATRSA